ncbi:MAG: GNAT family N-acetyltransferase [Bacteroidota bacterium]
MTITYRRWQERDLSPIREILRKTWLDAYSFIPESDLTSYLEKTYDEASMKKLFADPTVNGFVAEAEGTVAGFVRTKFNKEEERHYVSSLYILPEFQSKGIGRTLMVMAADEAVSHGLDRIWLGVMVENRSAVDWYKGMGFQVAEEEPFTMGSTKVNHYIGYVPVQSVKKGK